MALNNLPNHEVFMEIRDRLDILIELLTANTEKHRFKVALLGSTPGVEPSMLTSDLSTGNTTFLGAI